jgi:hypothetical protein
MDMKKFFFVALAGLPMFLFVAPIPADQNPLAAPPGCCKQRSSTNNDNWQPNRLDYTNCELLNRSRDEDNLVDPQGLIWWDLNCRP